MRTRFLTLLSLAVLVLVASRTARAWELMTTSDGVPVVWMGGAVSFVLDAAGTDQLARDDVERAVAKAVDAWSDLPASSLEVRYDGTAAGLEVGYDPDHNTNVIAFEDTVWSFGDNALAATLSTWRVPSGELLDADIAVNSAEFSWAVDARGGAYDLPSALAHELGHAVGLGHSTRLEATMFASMGPGEVVKRDLHADDVEGFRYLYGEDDLLGPDGPIADPGAEESGDAGAFGFPSVGDSQRAGDRIPGSEETFVGCRQASSHPAGHGAVLLLAIAALATLRTTRRHTQND